MSSHSHRMKKRKTAHKHSPNYLIKHGYHIWVMVILANVLLLYALRFYILQSQEVTNLSTHAQSLTPTTQAQLTQILTAQTPTGQETSQTPVSGTQTPTPTPLGSQLNLSFSIPSIGSGGGNMNPIHKTRILTVYLYASNVNSLNPSVAPLYVVQGQATYDDNLYSPTYTSFSNPSFSLGAAVQPGNYQLAISSEYTLKTLVKTNPTDVGGTIISLSNFANSAPIVVPHQSLIPGDIVSPVQNNTLNINDFNAFVNCFGATQNTLLCPNYEAADLDDNGVVNGIDYNYLLDSFKTLLAEGYPVPSLVPPSPTQTQIKPLLTQKIIRMPTAIPQASNANNNSLSNQKKPKGQGIVIVALLLFVFLLVLALYFINLSFKNFVNGLIQNLPFIPKNDTQQADETPVENNDNPTISEASTQTPDAQTVIAADPTPLPASGNQDGIIEKEFYIKKLSLDAQNNVTRLVLTGDEGQIDAIFHGQVQVAEGFAKIKGVMKKDGETSYFDITEILPED